MQARIQAPGNTDMKLDSQYLIEVQIRSCEETQLYDHIKDHIKMRSREENIKMTIDQHQICMLFLAVQNSSIGDLSLTHSVTVTVLLLLTYKERPQKLVTFETLDQSDEETRPVQHLLLLKS